MTSTPAGINCGAACPSQTSFFTSGTTVSLAASASADSTFVSWSGACNGTANPCSVVMDGAKTVGAQFCLKPTAVRIDTPTPFSSAPPYSTPYFTSTVTPTGTAPVVNYYGQNYFTGKVFIGSSSSGPTFPLNFTVDDAAAKFGCGGFIAVDFTADATACGTTTSPSAAVNVTLDTCGAAICSGAPQCGRILSVGDGVPLNWVSELAVPGARGQVVLNGRAATFPGAGRSMGQGPMRNGENRLEVMLVSGEGRPGTWRFELPADLVRPGSLQVIAGEVLELTQSTVVLRFAGRPGQRAVLAFTAR